MEANSSLIVKWNGPFGAYSALFVRGLRPDGRFYGEATKECASPYRFRFEGMLTPEDAAGLFELAAQIFATPPQNPGPGALIGLLALGEVARPKRIYEFHESDDSESNGSFRLLVSQLAEFIHE